MPSQLENTTMYLATVNAWSVMQSPNSTFDEKTAAIASIGSGLTTNNRRLRRGRQRS
jgi:hypothetical protein